ncbi:MAG: tetratricopeptide repeat protein [Planctomycetota bacterium]
MMRALMVSVLLALAVGGEAWGRDHHGSWELDGARYKRLSMFERAQYEKAYRLFDDDRYAAAASEFEKFRVQFPDSPAFSYVLLMSGRCLHLGKKRHQAIKMYNEVLDFFADSTRDAVPALHYMAMAHFENGSERKGLDALSELVEDPEYMKHPLAPAALRYLASHYDERDDADEAVKYWKRVIEHYGRARPRERGDAWRKVVAYYMRKGDFRGLDSWQFDGLAEDDDKERYRRLDIALKVGASVFRGKQDSYYGPSAEQKAFTKYLQAAKSLYEKTGNMWQYHCRMLEFAAGSGGDRAAMKKAFEEVVKWVNANMSETAELNRTYSWLLDRTCRARLFTEAVYCADKIQGDRETRNRTYSRLIDLMCDGEMYDEARQYLEKLEGGPAMKAHKEYEILGRQGDWKKAVGVLQRIVRMRDREWSPKALNSMAWVYHDRLKQYDRAIKLYQEIADPPRTLWAIQDCQYKNEDLEKALVTLNEIENMFPKDAPRAAWQKAVYHKRAYNREMAIKHARRIMKMYPRSRESSQAHQMLEEFGVATGGAVTE